METDIRKLPIIPDEPTLYMKMIAIIDCYDQLHNLKYFMDDLDFIRSHIKNTVLLWRDINIK
jgi:hypothetical protein